MYAKSTPAAAVVIVIVAAIALAVSFLVLHPGRETKTITNTAAAPVTNSTPNVTASPATGQAAGSGSAGSGSTDGTKTAQPTSAGVVLPSTPPNYSPIPENALAEKGLDFGFLTKVTQKNGVVTLTFDRANFYTGAEARQHNGGQAPPDDYVIVDDNTKLRTFTLAPKASLQAENQLRTDPSVVGRQTLTLNQFLHNYASRLNPDAAPGVWLRHTDGSTGAVTALAEQFMP